MTLTSVNILITLTNLLKRCIALITERYGDTEIRSISPYSLQMRENADQNNSEYGHFLRSGNYACQKNWQIFNA